MRRKREPGTRKPLSWPLSKQRMIVCWLTLQILAASPVVKTVFMNDPFLAGSDVPAHEEAPRFPVRSGDRRPPIVPECTSVPSTNARSADGEDVSRQWRRGS